MSDAPRTDDIDKPTDRSNFRDDDEGASGAADGSNREDPQDHPLHGDRIDPDGIIEDAEENQEQSPELTTRPKRERPSA